MSSHPNVTDTLTASNGEGELCNKCMQGTDNPRCR